MVFHLPPSVAFTPAALVWCTAATARTYHTTAAAPFSRQVWVRVQGAPWPAPLVKPTIAARQDTTLSAAVAERERMRIVEQRGTPQGADGQP
jgi:hypothetical protein